MMKTYRKKFLLCLQEKDYELLKQKAKEAHMTKSGFLRQMLYYEEASKILELLRSSYEFNTQMLFEISRVAGNINQIAHRLNSGIQVNQEIFSKEANETKRIFAEFQAIAQGNHKLLKRILNA